MELAEAIKSWKGYNSLEIFFVILGLSWYEKLTFVTSERWKSDPILTGAARRGVTKTLHNSIWAKHSKYKSNLCVNDILIVGTGLSS